jgi:hypothetical protein
MKFPVRRKMNNFEDYHSNEDFPQHNNTDGELKIFLNFKTRILYMNLGNWYEKKIGLQFETKC